jgi:hypothetical protein
MLSFLLIDGSWIKLDALSFKLFNWLVKMFAPKAVPKSSERTCPKSNSPSYISDGFEFIELISLFNQ